MQYPKLFSQIDSLGYFTISPKRKMTGPAFKGLSPFLIKAKKQLAAVLFRKFQDREKVKKSVRLSCRQWERRVMAARFQTAEPST
jgi:hypothetical protein